MVESWQELHKFSHSITALAELGRLEGPGALRRRSPFEFAEVKGHKSMTPKQLKAPSQMVAGLSRFFWGCLEDGKGLDGLEGLVDNHFSWQKIREGWRKKTQVNHHFEIHFLQKFEEEKHTPQLLNKYTPEV